MANSLKFSKEEIESAKKNIPSLAFSPDEIAEAQAATIQREPTLPEQIETGGASLLSGMTFGASEPAVAGLNALISKGIDQYFRMKEEAQGIPQPETTPSLSELYSQNVERRKGLKESAKGADIAGEILGAVSPMGAGGLLMKGVAKGAKALQGGKELAGLAKVAATVGEEAAKGAVTAGGQGVVQEQLLQPTGFISPEEKKSVAEQMGFGAMVGGAIPGAAAAVKGAGKLAKSGINTFLGVKPEVVTKFLANPDAVINAKSPEQIREIAQQAAQRIRQNEAITKLDLTDDVALGLATLKKQIMDASENAYATLEQSSNKVPLAVIKDQITKAGSDLELPGMVGPQVQAAKEKIKNFVTSLDGLPDEVDGVTLKRIVKSLDDDLDFLSAGEFAGTRSQAVMLKARGNVDSVLKSQFSAYKEAIKPVRELSQFHDEIFKDLSKPEKVFTSLSKMGKPGNEIKDARLQKFFKQTNVDPERFRQAKADADLLGAFENTATAETKVKAMLGGKSEAVKQQFKRLSELEGIDFEKEIENINVGTAFEKEFLRGSRNVNLWTVIGGASGGALGAGIPGAVFGAAVGGVIDKHGPKIAQQMLKGYASIQGVPTVKKIRQAFQDLPPDLRKDIEESFTRAVISQSGDAEPTFIPKENRVDVEQAIKQAEHLSAMDRAKMLRDLNKNGEITGLKRILGTTGAKFKQNIDMRKQPEQDVNLKSVSEFIKSRKQEL